ncbi:MAG: aminopeptidase [bacterium]|jgi:predicted aminopeptidase|nr:aminopeptidase [bacterium]
MVYTLAVALFLWVGAVDLELGYFWHLTKGQISLLWRARPISRVLKEAKLDPEIRKSLMLVEEIRQFAADDIGLSASRNYTTYVDIGPGPVSWNLVVCARDQLTPKQWTYPVVGTVPYRGYFRREEAEAERDRYAAEGYDTYLRPVSAFSTLGWFPDPVLSTMLRYEESDLADVLIHELTHATIWISGDVTFNESLASFVGEAGALLWLQKRYGKDTPVVQQVLDARADARVFRQFMSQIAAGLDSLYQSDLTTEQKLAKRQAVFNREREAYHRLPLKTDLYDGFTRWEVNNARIALYRVYQEDTGVFQRVYTAVGEMLPRAIAIFKQCEKAEDPAAYLTRWLARQ